MLFFIDDNVFLHNVCAFNMFKKYILSCIIIKNEFPVLRSLLKVTNQC